VDSIFTAAEQAIVLIDITVTETALFVWAFWSLEQHKAKLKESFSRRKHIDASLRSFLLRRRSEND
jgi:hypothetical protein